MEKSSTVRSNAASPPLSRSTALLEVIDNGPGVPEHLRERIFHHQTNDIAGVIFGPRCSDQFKRKVDLTLLDNRRRAGNKPFVLLDTELTHDSRVRD